MVLGEAMIGREIEITETCCGLWGNAHPGHRWLVTRENLEVADDLVQAGLAKFVELSGMKERERLTDKQVDERMRVLVYTPYGRLERRTVESIFALEYDGFVDRMFTCDNPYIDGHRDKNIQLAYEKMRQIVVREGYRKVFIVESDMIVPPDALKKLLEVDAPVATGLYCMRREPYGSNIFQSHGGRGIGMARQAEELKEMWGQTIDCSGGCTGCLLVDASVLGEFPWTRGHSSAPDYDYMTYCHENGIRQVARLDVMCGHIKPGGDVIWPDRETGYRVERAGQ